MSISKINKKITLEFLQEPENLYFDRKSAKIDLRLLANEIMSFANANGGIIAVGIANDGTLEGFNQYGIQKLNEVQKVVSTFLKGAISYECEIIDIINNKEEKDKIILFHIEPSMNHVIRNSKDEVYCRQGDSSIKLSYDQVRSLEYDRKERNFETEILMDSSVNDIDEEIVTLYKEKLETDLGIIEILKARGFLKEKDGELKLTNAGMLLFGKNPSLYFPCARLRVIKFEGNEFQVGKEMNVVKEKTFDKNLYRILKETREFIKGQLREFNFLTDNGTFEKHPEYPEFAWYEGIVNAVTHRDYTNSGEQIIVKIYNNRMEISSPGKLGGFVTIDTIQNKRYSRNPQIARTLSEFGIVRELNEGVKRIFREMDAYHLKEPVYTEPDRNSVLLVLENNVEKRSNVKTTIGNEKIEKIWDDLSHLEQQTIRYIIENGSATREEISEFIGRSKTSAINLLRNMIEKKLIVWTGITKSDKLGRYIIKK